MCACDPKVGGGVIFRLRLALLTAPLSRLIAVLQIVHNVAVEHIAGPRRLDTRRELSRGPPPRSVSTQSRRGAPFRAPPCRWRWRWGGPPSGAAGFVHADVNGAAAEPVTTPACDRAANFSVPKHSPLITVAAVLRQFWKWNGGGVRDLGYGYVFKLCLGLFLSRCKHKFHQDDVDPFSPKNKL